MKEEAFKLPAPIAVAYESLRPEMFDHAIAYVREHPLSAEDCAEILRCMKDMAAEVYETREKLKSIQIGFEEAARNVTGGMRRLGKLIGEEAAGVIADEED